MNTSSPTAVEQRALLEQLTQAVERSPRAFTQDASVAVGVGTAAAPTWLCLELSASGPGRGVTQNWVADDVDAALFMPSDGEGAIISGDTEILKAALQHLLGGPQPAQHAVHLDDVEVGRRREDPPAPPQAAAQGRARHRRWRQGR
jgi:hypothetical protein